MQSILDNNDFKFENIITLVNRMSYYRNKEIESDLNVSLYTFVNLFVPPSKDPEIDCSLCAKHKHYANLKEYSVIDSCIELITEKQRKIEKKEYNKYEADNKEADKPKILNDRQFQTMLIKHTIYYRISGIIHNFEYPDQNRNKLYKPLDTDIRAALEALYSEYVTKDKNNNNRENEFAFLKAISQAPLSNYAKIKNYAHKKLLEVLSNLLNQDEKNSDNYNLLRVILQRLSMLNSNALIRREVIIKSWEFYFEYKKYLNQEIEKRKTQEKTETGIFLDKIKQEIREFEQEIEKSSDFKSEFQFFIKNAIFENETKSLYLGELIRTGTEVNIELFKAQEGTSKTQMNNELFTHFDNRNYKEYASEYKEFLNWLFYDNTTNIRKTLQNFENELEKEDNLKGQFYDGGALKKFSDVVFDSIETEINKKIETEYYYSVFKQYISQNQDDIKFTEKILYVLYAKNYIAELKEKPDIKKLDGLLEVFAKIMGADAAFFSLKHINKIEENDIDMFTVAKYGISEDAYDKIEKFQIPFNQYYTSNILQQQEEYYKRFPYPLILNYKLDNKYEENEILQNGKENHFISLLVSNPDNKDGNNEDETELFGVITFILKNKYEHTHNFEIEVKEHGRLLLLLKKEIIDFTKDYLIEKKVFDLWIEKTYSQKTFDRIYRKSDHIFRSVKEEMEEFMNLPTNIKEKFSKTWFWLTNEMIGYIYSTIEYNRSKQLNFEESNRQTHTLGEIFDGQFSELKNIISQTRWENKAINFDNNFNKKTLTPFNKYFILTFIFQCINNTFDIRKNIANNVSVKIDIKDNSITIYDVFSNNDSIYQRKKNTEKFREIKPYIQKLDLKKYSSTTLTSLQAYINFVNKTNPLVSCDYDFNEDNCFYVKINF